MGRTVTWGNEELGKRYAWGGLKRWCLLVDAGVGGALFDLLHHGEVQTVTHVLEAEDAAGVSFWSC